MSERAAELADTSEMPIFDSLRAARNSTSAIRSKERSCTRDSKNLLNNSEIELPGIKGVTAATRVETTVIRTMSDI